MLEKIIKKMFSRVCFSFYGILTIITMLLPFVVIAFGIYFMVSGTNQYGILWIVIGAMCFVFSLRKFKDYFDNLKYLFSPKKYPVYKKLVEEGADMASFDAELAEADPVKNLNKNNPVLITKNFIFGYNQVAFFVLNRNKVIWAYEYNGNGIVFLDYYKNYGFTYFVTVDGNDILMETLKHDMPYIYFGTDFDYKTIMHDKFDETVAAVENEKALFEADPEGYRLKKAEEERLKAEEEAKRLEEEKAKSEENISEEAPADADSKEEQPEAQEEAPAEPEQPAEESEEPKEE